VKAPAIFYFISALLVVLAACENNKKEKSSIENCTSDDSLSGLTIRNFNMGFSTWSFGPDSDDLENTYQFIGQNADIYSEHIDNKIPWSAWIK
jgi:hypothetical protein